MGIEPNIGISNSVGEKHEFVCFLGYDQHLITYNRVYKRHPNKLSLTIGINRIINNQIK